MRRAKHRRVCIRRKVEDSDEEQSEEECDDMVWTNQQKVYFHAAVSLKTVGKFIQCVDTAVTYALQHRHTQIYVFIHSCGGDCYAGLSAMDHLKACELHVTTVADGYVASAGTFMLLGGDKRLGLPNSSILIHQLSTGFFGKYEELKEELSNSETLMETIRKLYACHTNMDSKVLDEMLKCDRVHCFERAVELGILQGKYVPAASYKSLHSSDE